MVHLRIWAFFVVFRLIISSSAQYGRIEDYDAHPYVLGWPDIASKAHSVCVKHNTRLCSLQELDTYAKNNRSGCIKAWVYNPISQSVVGGIAHSQAKPCFEADASKYALPPYGALPISISFNPNTYYFYFCAFSLEEKQKIYECNGNGEDYIGYKAVTASGKNCQVWEIQEPNVHEETPRDERYPNLQRNYCRNPNGLKKPWCYLADSVGWEYCDVNCQPYGPFDQCQLFLYDLPNFAGNECSYSVNASSSTWFNFGEDWDNCRDLYRRVMSVRLVGSYCHAVFRYRDHYVKISGKSRIKDFRAQFPQLEIFVDDITLFDLSADVVLADYEYIKSFNKITNSMHHCSPEEIDYAVDILKIDKSGPNLGYAWTGNGFVLYTHSNVKESFLKQSWCCLDERPSLYNHRVPAENARGYCANIIRSDYFELLELTRVYTRFRRLCTVNDIISHLNRQNQQMYYGWVASSEDTVVVFFGHQKLHALITNYSHLGPLPVFCCDEDCLPLFYRCKEDKQCCTLNCYLGQCKDSNYPFEEGIDYSLNKPQPLKTWQRIVILIVGLYILGFTMRCCCPKRRNLNRNVKIE